jgi:transcriptional regulator with XRE-family HTH domain
MALALQEQRSLLNPQNLYRENLKLAIANQKNISNLLKRLRLKAGLKQQELSDKLKWNNSRTHRFEKGEMKLYPESAAEYSRACGFFGHIKNDLLIVGDPSGLDTDLADRDIETIMQLSKKIGKIHPALRLLLDQELQSIK